MSVQEAGDADTTLEHENDENGAPVIATELLADHMARVVALLVGESNLELIKEPLDNAAVILEKFINDPQVTIFAVDRLLQRDESSDENTGKDRLMTVIFVKKNPTIVADAPIQDQMLATPLDSGDPYGSICAHIGKVLAPFFKSVIRDQRRNEHEGDKLVPAVEKGLNEVEVALLHLRQNIDIPDVELVVHPKILQAVERARERGTKANVSDLGADAADTSFLNALQAGVNRWTTDIQKITSMDRNPDSGTSMQEVAFWLNLEHALNKINQQRESEGVCLTLDVLNHAKRFHATTSFDTNAGLKERLNMANNYNSFMRDLPLNDLISAASFDAIKAALTSIFNVLKKVRNSNYPAARTNSLLRALSRDTTNQILKVLQSQRLLAIPIDEFEQIYKKCADIIGKWEAENEKIAVVMRQRKRDDTLLKTGSMRNAHLHKVLEKRLDSIREFRRQHEQLSTVIARVVRVSEAGTPSDGGNPVREVAVAYDYVKEVDCLDLSPEGERAWADAVRYYEDRISRVETQLATRFREQLRSTRSAEEMFKIFSRYNLLFYRKHIKSAIREYQTKLIERVKEDIQDLQTKFEDPEARRRAIWPPKIQWHRMIQKQLDKCMERVAAVLGEEWDKHRDGIELKRVSEHFRQKLNPDAIFKAWSDTLQSRSVPEKTRMLLVERQQRDGRLLLSLKVNFSPELIEVVKAVRTMRSMNFRAPFRIMNTAHYIYNVHPFAASLIQSVRDYDCTNRMVAGAARLGDPGGQPAARHPPPLLGRECPH
ncbi:hypothetical protein M3Y99_00794000 [Aphelenchoides fujianensis]|nr:hypothetical protein M3Y99_00794000 [Aphelenchoides fujianensis]